jgi:hypothetical protein
VKSHEKLAVAGLLLATWFLPVSAQTLPFKPSALPKDGVEGLVVNSTVSGNGMIFFSNFLEFLAREVRQRQIYPRDC